MGMSQKDVATKMGLNSNYVYQIEAGKQAVSARFASDFCRLFDVNENWLRTGEGDLFIVKSRHEEIAEFMKDLTCSDADNFKVRLISVLAELDEKEWAVLAEITQRLADKKKDQVST